MRAGVKELLVISQDTSAYGVDVKYRTGFWGGRPLEDPHDGALPRAGRAGRLGPPALRLSLSARGRSDPADERGQDPSVPRCAVPAREPAHPEAHEAAGGREKNLERIRAWRAECPEITLRSTFIVGFPGETEAEFEELLAFLGEAQLDRVGCFAYSPVEGARANALPHAVPEAVKQERRARFMQAQAQVSRARLARKVGRVVEVIVDEVKGTHAVGRSAAEAPEIDGVVQVAGAKGLRPGDFARVRITAAGEHDLAGRVLARR